MSKYEPSGKTVTRTFRIEKNWDNALLDEADRQDISVSALLDHIVRRYVYVQRFDDQFSTISIDHHILINFLECMTEEEIVEAAKNSGSILPEEALLRRGLTLNFKNLVWLIDEIYSKYNGWFESDHYVTDTDNMFHLRHNINRKWSLYLSNHISSMFKSILDIDLKPSIRDDSITFYIPNRYLKCAHA